ncbi:hypothetical protein [Ornithinibacillus halotolerans]|uniref:Uncharacterized protein n=1 Tax=Ornithinibacillus halotolerans TaxID=1274357 RepID=A0A916W773_9BACI|nr:hypothetical protein [Ornithinibacillus halotolerans]GGA71605.1 hypothetical protein GCM10008025_14400 [Ornithinibacillus halotolerans]
MEKIIHKESEADFIQYAFVTLLSLLTFKKIRKLESYRLELKKKREQKDEHYRV